MIENLKQKFSEYFTGEGDLFFSPGRINLIGEHIDYNGGMVFPLAISLGTYGIARKREDSICRLVSGNFEDLGVIEFDMNKELVKGGVWADYAKGVVSEIRAKHTLTNGFDLYLYGNLPNGASLSSSASLELLIGVIVDKYNNLNMDRVDLVMAGVGAENNFMGLHCGIMDQFACGMSKKGTAILLNCATVEYKYAPLELGDCSILIMNTNKRRELVKSAYNDRRRECEEALELIKTKMDVANLCEVTPEDLDLIKNIFTDEIIYKRAYHAITEQDRVLKTFDCLNKGDLVSVGKFLNASHESLRNNYEVTGLELDTLVDLAQACDGVLGARMVGAGFAGCAIAICKTDKISDIINYVKPRYKEAIGYDADFYIAEGADGTKMMED